MGALEVRNGLAVELAMRAQDAKIAALAETVRVLTNHIGTLQSKMDAMHSIQAKALQERYRGGTSGD